MSKATTIRKKALDLVRQQDWANAIKEYRRLVELDQNNPNVHNELADLYLRTGQKSEAYDSFVLAIDEYTRVGLFNNAVAVCKKVLRVLPARVEVLNKLGLIRMKQGLAKEAESYYLSFLEKAAGGSFDSKSFSRIAGTILEEMSNSPSVLQKLAQCLLGYKLNDEAGDVLIKLYILQEANRDTSGCEDTRALAVKLGFGPKLDATRKARPGTSDRTVVTEDNIWTKTHSEGDRMDAESGAASSSLQTPPSQPSTAPASAQPAGAVPGGPSERDQWLLRLARGVGGGPKTKAPAPEPTAPAPATATATEAPPQPASTPPPPAPEVSEVEPSFVETEPVATEIPVDDIGDIGMEDELPPIPESPPMPPAVEVPSPPPAKSAPASAPAKEAGMQISALIQDDDADPGAEEDYRSHYDLGMAYMEMDLLSEAIREYQVASKSQQFQVKCLEMIGLCFLKQNQPTLAIRQLTKALSLIGNDGDESMGIKYSLGLAYEMTGELDQARTHFEDVYVVDVTFRDVSEKIKKLSG